MPSPSELVRQAEQLSDEQWYEFLDELDEASRRRSQRQQVPPVPQGAGRDEVAAWVAKTHLLVDRSVKEVWYLPHGSPPDEIRFLELNGHLINGATPVQAIDFGLDVEGAAFRLVVADVSREQLEQARQDASQLPPGWSLEGSTVWRRGA